MSAEVEFHDSTIHEISAEGPDVVLRLRPAYIRCREEDGSLVGYTQDVDLRFRRAPHAPTVTTPVWMADGKLEVEGEHVIDGVVPVPHTITGRIRFSGHTAEGQEFVILADGFDVAAVGDREFVEHIE